MKHSDDVRSWVKDYYGEVLASKEDLKTSACCAGGAPPAWLRKPLDRVHREVAARFYGCGYPIPEVLAGATILDLGSGSGRDVYVLSQLVGAQGFVHGVDMTASQLELARKHIDGHMQSFGYAKPNVAFHEGYIEDLTALPIEEGSVDVIVSNCVVNLSPRKDLVLREAYRLLKPGGELYFSDVFVDRRLPEEVAFDPLLHSECLGGAMYEPDFLDLAKQVGFIEPREMTRHGIEIRSREIVDKTGAARFSSVTLRLFKLEGLDTGCEDYGQSAVYHGTIESSGAVYWLDDRNAFEVGRPERICRNTALMLQQTRLAEHFKVIGEAKVHYGPFPCDPTLAAAGRRPGSEEVSAPGPAPGGLVMLTAPPRGGCC